MEFRRSKSTSIWHNDNIWYCIDNFLGAWKWFQHVVNTEIRNEGVGSFFAKLTFVHLCDFSKEHSLHSLAKMLLLVDEQLFENPRAFLSNHNLASQRNEDSRFVLIGKKNFTLCMGNYWNLRYKSKIKSFPPESLLISYSSLLIMVSTTFNWVHRWPLSSLRCDRSLGFTFLGHLCQPSFAWKHVMKSFKMFVCWKNIFSSQMYFLVPF